jgi:hypothetical protein
MHSVIYPDDVTHQPQAPGVWEKPEPEVLHGLNHEALPAFDPDVVHLAHHGGGRGGGGGGDGGRIDRSGRPGSAAYGGRGATTY